jgi:membrane-bound lytic murein transglycosylase D
VPEGSVAPALGAARAKPAASLPGGEAAGTATLLADPSNYLVADNDTVEVQAAETLSHYAGWLGVTTDELRKANGWARQRSLVLGERVRLVFGSVGRDAFVSRRIEFHRAIQDEFFTRYRITNTTEHRLREGESVWVLASQKYKVPVWLLRQYNPRLDLNQVRPGTRVVFPRVVRVA